eukprot:c37174_g1_i1 orf=197-655(-)
MGTTARQKTRSSCRINNTCFTKGLQGMASLKVLIMPYNTGLPMVAQVSEFCKLLEVIDLTKCRTLNNLAVQKIAQGCPSLRFCNLSRCHYLSLSGWQKALALSSTKLEDSNVSGCREFCAASLLALQDGCPSLHRLNLLHCPILDFAIPSVS